MRIMARRADDETEGHWGSLMANILFINSADIDETHFYEPDRCWGVCWVGAGGRGEMLIGLWRGGWQVGSHATERCVTSAGKQGAEGGSLQKGPPTPENSVP